MELSPEEKRKIYEEEKTRIETQETIKREKEAEASKKDKALFKKGCLGCLGFIVIIILISLLNVLFNSRDDGGSSSTGQPSDAGVVNGHGKDVIRQELNRWSEIGFVTSYEFTEKSVVVYLNYSDWISLPSNSRADFKAGIRSKWPYGSVTFRDSKTGETL